MQGLLVRRFQLALMKLQRGADTSTPCVLLAKRFSITPVMLVFPGTLYLVVLQKASRKLEGSKTS